MKAEIKTLKVHGEKCRHTLDFWVMRCCRDPVDPRRRWRQKWRGMKTPAIIRGRLSSSHLSVPTVTPPMSRRSRPNPETTVMTSRPRRVLGAHTSPMRWHVRHSGVIPSALLGSREVVKTRKIFHVPRLTVQYGRQTPMFFERQKKPFATLK